MSHPKSLPYGLPTLLQVRPVRNIVMSKPVFIYVLVDPRTNRARYVGKTDNLKRRYSCHLATAKLRDSHLRRWLYTLTSKGKRPKMQVLEITDATNWQEREQFWINTLRKQGENLVNTSDGGKGGSGKHTVNARQKISAARQGMTFSDEHRQHLKDSRHEMMASAQGTALRDSISRAYGVITDEQVIEVWRLAHEGKIPQWKIGEMFGIPPSTVSEIKHNKRYKHVKRPER